MFIYLILILFHSRLAFLMGEGTDGQPTDGSSKTTQGTPRKKRTTPKKLVPRKMKKI
jgi:hypothetical protein